MKPPFYDRREAGRRLGDLLRSYARKPDVLVLGLAPGGVPVAFEVAETLGSALDVFVLRTLAVPGREDLVLGAIAAGGVRVLDWSTISQLDLPHGTIESIARNEAIELARLERYYRTRKLAPKMTGRTIVLVDDGLTPAPTVRAALRALRAYHPARLILALPIVTEGAPNELRPEVDELIFAAMRATLDSPAEAYEDESSVSDREVRHLLSDAEAWGEPEASRPFP